MQCQQPLFGIGYPNTGQYLLSNPANLFNSLPPDVIGEGEVNSITFPDGSIQYYFLPVNWQSDVYLKRWPPYPFNDTMYCNSYNRPKTGVWIIRHFSNTVSPVYNQYWQRPNLDSFSQPCFSYDNNVAPTGFQLKFHNDCWTSTTDLHYFCPREPPMIAVTRSAAIQVETPNQLICCCQPNNTTICNDPWKADCTQIAVKENKGHRCKCKKFEKYNPSRMSIDKPKTSSSANFKKTKFQKKKKKSCSCSKKATKTNINIIGESDFQSSTNETDTTNGDQKQIIKGVICECGKLSKTEAKSEKLAKKKSKVNGECNVQGIADKGVTTYSDQASSVKEVEGQTQTGAGCSCSSIDIKEQVFSDNRLWIPNRKYCLNQKRASRSSEKIIGVCQLSSSECDSSSTYKTSRESIK